MALANIGRKALGIIMGIIVLPAALLVKMLDVPFSIAKTIRADGNNWLITLMIASISAVILWAIMAFVLAGVTVASSLGMTAKGYYVFAKEMREKNYGLLSTTIATLTLGSVVAASFLLFGAISSCVVTPLFFLPFRGMRVAKHEGVKAALMLPVTLLDRLGIDDTGSLFFLKFSLLTPAWRRAAAKQMAWKQKSKAFSATIYTAESLAARAQQAPALTEGELDQFEYKILPTLPSEEVSSQCKIYREQMKCAITHVLAECPVTVLLPEEKSNESKEDKESKKEIPYKVYERVALQNWIKQYIESKPNARAIPEPCTKRNLNALRILPSYPQSFEAFVSSVRGALTPAVEQKFNSARSMKRVSVITHSLFSKPNPFSKALKINVLSHENPTPKAKL